VNPLLISIGIDPTSDITGSLTAGGLLTRTGGERWLNGNTLNLSSLTSVDNNSSFAFRILAAHDPSGSTFVRSDTGSSPIVSSGTWRFDMVTITGDLITAVPEPTSMALVGLAVMGTTWIRRRR
jgi:hypothetical protein